MKKLFLLVFIFASSFSMQAVTTNDNFVDDCSTYAGSAVYAEEAHYGEMSLTDWVEAYHFYYDLCEESDTDFLLSPVFL